MRKMINTILAVVAMLIAAAHARIGPTSLQTLRAVQTTGKGPSISSANAVDATGITAGGVTFKNAKAREYYVDGRTIPLMDFDIGTLRTLCCSPIGAEPREQDHYSLACFQYQQLLMRRASCSSFSHRRNPANQARIS
ncbi:uncharacterized protein L969DRAFT_385000 [Mixia osmundae IAM 14324]|uniref:uncharacterized protein n=1 Tax=Mixia osmundae (strain CBS 9802 / IAM 14324 / JCM 22182 / KY 12970) TaxID=764103 RepID=UPI0004A54D58|nr:uncharacterized protein L969DRAFT_385000 [Mixia osmundae IAM 14324]KEI39905.1 hypothetical protein L969DRAFT_385000 [Mixia osmundae IAM 14324]